MEIHKPKYSRVFKPKFWRLPKTIRQKFVSGDLKMQMVIPVAVPQRALNR